MNLIKKGSTDVTRYVMLVDSATGAPETGYTITSLDLQYTRNRTAPAAKVDATALAATDSAHGDNQAIQIDATSSPGLYRVDWPDAAFATGADKVILVVSGTGLAPAVEEIQLVNFDSEDGVRLGLTALPNAAADAAGGLPISDAGGLDLDAKLANTNEVTVARMGALTDWINGGRLDLILDDILLDTGTTLDGKIDTIDGIVDSILLDTAEIGAAGAGLTNINLPNQTMDITGNITGNLSGSVGTVTTVNGLAAGVITAASIAADAITDAKVAADVTIASVTGAVGSVTGNVGGNVSGSVGSVVGAVGSVTGNVGGNVTGSVGSVVGAVGSVAGAVGSVTGLTASDVGAIKAKTDSLAFTVAGQVDSNVQYVNDVLVNGTGALGDEWGP
jgi:hypothetical protein